MLRVLFAASISIAVLSGCAIKDRAAVETQGDATALEVYLFAARGFLGGSEYERYHFKSGALWRECGEIDPKVRLNKEQQKVEGDEILPKDPSLIMRERRVEYLEPAQLEVLLKTANAFLHDQSRSQRRPPLPGSVFSLSEPGMFELMVQLGQAKERLVTSVDALTEEELIGTTLGLTAASHFFEKVRSFGPVMCNSETFFGIARR